jgi:hypothetical protein
MTVYYVDAGRPNDTGDGLSISTAKKTWSAVEALPIAQNSLVNIKPGIYRETLTLGVAGSAGNTIEYRGDPYGLVFGTPGVVRLTGSDNDQTATRSSCITAGSGKNYRIFQNIALDMVSGNLIDVTAATNWIIASMFLSASASKGISLYGACTTPLIRDCFFTGLKASPIYLTGASAVDNTAAIIQRCLIDGSAGGQPGIGIDYWGGVSIKDTMILNSYTGVRCVHSPSGGQVNNVNNCVISGCAEGIKGILSTDITDDYNSVSYCTTPYTVIVAGAHSNAYPPLFDSRWFWNLRLAGAGPNNVAQVVSPFDLSSYSPLLNLAGSGARATDMRGTAVQGAQLEWGALEYDASLSTMGRPAKVIGG